MIFDDAIVSKHALIQKRSTKFSIVAVIMIEEMEDWNLLIVDMVRMLYEDDHDHK